MPYYPKEMKAHIENALARIEKAIYQSIGQLTIVAWVTPEPVPFEKRMSGVQKTFTIGQKWGELWDCAWFHFSGEIPENVTNQKVVLLIDISGEACIVDDAGCPLQGLTNVSSEFDRRLGKPGKRIVPVTLKSKGGEKIDLWADGGCNDLFGKYQDSGIIKEAYIGICNEDLRQLYWDFEVLYELLPNLPEESARHQRILFVLNDAVNILRNYSNQEAQQARKILQPELAKKGGDSSLTIQAVGHAHIDLAWLWPIRETIRKGARTFATALQLMEIYPDYVFGASQPQLYQWIKDYYPSLFEKIKHRVAEGRWEPQGAMWVEADTNISGGEALIRQIIYGKKFFKDEFAKDMKILWLPDVFGYSAALPQILKKSGVEYFTTIKLSWNKFNQMPHHTFFWEGLDGSKVLVHMPPEGTYNSSAAPRAIHQAELNFLDKGVSDRCLMMFGIGDGGGGAGEEHLERLSRERDLNGLLPVRQAPALEFFEHIEKDGVKYKSWYGELYFELHQGTYTTQARNKRFNRKLEISLRELEYSLIQAGIVAGLSYPKAELDQIWKEMLLYQFHDILPGSSIQRVYEESSARYRYLSARTRQLTEATYGLLADKINTEHLAAPSLIVNSLTWQRDEWIRANGSWLRVSVPSMGYAVIDTAQEKLNDWQVQLSTESLENDCLRIEWNSDGSIRSIWDKEFQRQIIVTGECANRLAIYEDSGDAWDFPIYYNEKPPEFMELQSAEPVSDGPRVGVKQIYRYGQSQLTQEISLIHGSRRIDFKTSVEWHEKGKMLRTSFSVTIFTSEVCCDIQFGNIKRPTHRNTSWDIAKYEICAHKWVDLSQGDYGVALLNDCKYGYNVRENVLDLNLLRSPQYPDRQADQGKHEFTYALYPHVGNYIEGKVIQVAYELNIPLLVFPVSSHGGELPARISWIHPDAENTIIEAVKRAEDNDDIIIRLYECQGRSVKTKINLSIKFHDIRLVNLLEEEVISPAWDQQKMELVFRPFEIHTLRVIGPSL